MLKKETFHISGLHCRGCKTLIETEVDVLAGVKNITVNHRKGIAEIEYDPQKISLENIFKEISKLNYHPKRLNPQTSSNSNQARPSSNRLFWLGILFLFVFTILIFAYFFSQKFGGFELLSRLNETNVGYGIILLIGLLAGFHCVGMCGGLVVAYSTNAIKNEKKQGLLPHAQYNLGRFISYSLIGAILGGLGSFFAINPNFTGAVIIAAGFFMVIMGLSFIFNYAILDKLKLRTPDFIARYLFRQKHGKKPKGPLIIGLLNGFMPCGPLQAMQLYALTSGSVVRGGISMALYALGTIPMMFGFGAFISTLGQDRIKKIIKFSGALIIVLGLFMANRGLANFGYGLNSISFNAPNHAITLDQGEKEKYQTINMELNYLGYKPNVLYIKKGVPVKWVINVKQMSGCTNAIMIESLGIKKDLSIGENIIKFTPPDSVKEIKFSCWMRMVWGKFIITDDSLPLSQKDLKEAAASLPKNSSCGCGS